MNSKFYVSLEAARLLKEKGFNKPVDKLIHLNQYKIPIIESPEKYYDESEIYNDYLYLKKSHYACPTKAEAIDWLNSKGLVIVLSPATIQQKDGTNIIFWRFYVVKGTEGWYNNYGDYKTRLEAEEAAIIKALKLL